MITVTGKLTHGIELDGALHIDFEIRQATIRDTINAIDKRNAAGENTDSYLVLKMYEAAEQLTKLGDLPKGKITAELLFSLPDDDIEPLLAALEDVKKKPKPMNETLSESPMLK